MLVFGDDGGLTECAFFTKDFTNTKTHKQTVLKDVNNSEIKI